MQKRQCKPISAHIPLDNFVKRHSLQTAKNILDGAPDKATLFVYAYVANSIDYLFIDEKGIWHVNHNGLWKPVVGFIVKSFMDIAFSLELLKDAVANAETEGV